MLTHGSLFSGIGGFDLGFERAGIKTLWQVENDPYAAAVLEKHWPNVKRYGDIKAIEWEAVEVPDIVSGGFPCQDLSGGHPKGRGLSGARSGLFYEYIKAINGIKPTWFVVENVLGFKRKNAGREFGQALIALDATLYNVAGRDIDARYFGVAQQRARTFLVGNSRSAAAAAEVLFKRSGDKRIDKTRRAAPLAVCITARGPGSLDDRETYIVEADGIRRLTPLEVERAMGFPDNWTEGLSDTRRYKLLGNAIVPQIAEWLGRRIIEFDLAR